MTLVDEILQASKNDILAEWIAGFALGFVLLLVVGFFQQVYLATKGNPEAVETVEFSLFLFGGTFGPIILMRITYRLHNWYESFR